MKKLFLISGLFLAGLLIGCNASLNKPVHIEDGETVSHDINTVNGYISIGENCTIEGDCRAVNGGIEIGKNSSVMSLISVNGRISVAEQCRILNEVTTINGSLEIGEGSELEDEASTINGSIKLSGVLAKKSIETVNGNIYLDKGTIVEGDVIIDSKENNKSDKNIVDIHLHGKSIVKGNIEVKGDRVKVTVHVGPECKILGDVINAELIYQ